MDLSLSPFVYFCQLMVYYLLSTVAHQFSVPLCHTNMFKNEFFIPQPEKQIKHSSFRIHACRTAVYYPSKQVLQLRITTCETYKTTSSTTFYFFWRKDQQQGHCSYVAFTCSNLFHLSQGAEKWLLRNLTKEVQ